MVAVNTEFSYYTDGQLESVKKGNGECEQMYWDDLALIKRGGTDYIVDPSVTGGNPIMAGDKVMFNDMLGNTLGNMDNGKFSGIQRTSFGETTGKVDDNLNFFTGKPQVEGLGYSFLFRNYRPEIGKWQTQDPMALVLKMPNQDIDVSQLEEYAPLGYPDGWNNLAYVNNNVTQYIDCQGTDWELFSDNYNSLFPSDYYTSWATGMTPGVMWRRYYHYAFTSITEGAVTTVIQGDTKTETSTVTFTQTITTTDYFMDENGNITSNAPVTYSPTTVSGTHTKVYKE